MTLKSPLLGQHTDRGGTLIPYPDPADPSRFAEVVEAFGPLELEYAALRKGCVLLDRPQRGTVSIKGEERQDYINRMFTQECKDLAAWDVRQSFWLNRKGRIDADMRVAALPDEIRLDLDVHAVARAVETLTSYLFSEDVTISDASESLHRLAVHGPTAILLLSAVAGHVAGPQVETLQEGNACQVRIGGHPTLVERHDWLGEIGLELTCAADVVAEVYAALFDAGSREDDLGQRVRLREAGWHACNIARIEAGTPLYFLDYGPEALPHETGVLRDRVSFTKGCYLGQEVVARIEALGQPKHHLVGLRFEGTEGEQTPLPEADAEVFLVASDTDKSAKPIGKVTSSTISPMLGFAPICFVMLKQAHTAPGTTVEVVAESTRVAATVQPQLTFWKRA
jgi:folate-binding protein YgfZ